MFVALLVVFVEGKKEVEQVVDAFVVWGERSVKVRVMLLLFGVVEGCAWWWRVAVEVWAEMWGISQWKVWAVVRGRRSAVRVVMGRRERSLIVECGGRVG